MLIKAYAQIDFFFITFAHKKIELILLKIEALIKLLIISYQKKFKTDMI